MFFLLSKLLDVLLEPLAWAILLGVLGLALRRRGPGLAAVLVLWAFSTEVVADALGRATEAGAVETARPDVVYDVVVVLGGSMNAAGTARSGGLELNDSADRLVRGFELLRAGRARFALLSAGAPEPSAPAPREAELEARLLASWGIDPARLLVEDRSRNTRENAVESARIVRERGFARVLLVTSAAHLPRALGCFRAVGLDPDALPVDWRAGGAEFSPSGLLPRARSLAQSADMLRELAGRLVYRAVGYGR